MKKSISSLVHLPVVFLCLVLILVAVVSAGCAALPAAGVDPTPGKTQEPPSATREPASLPGNKSIPFQTAAQGFLLSSTQDKPALRMAADAQSLDVLAGLVTSEHQTLLSGIDPETSVVLAAFWGARPYGGFSITIDKVSITDNQLTVNVILNENDPTLPKIEAVTYPYHVVVIDRSALPKDIKIQYRLVNREEVLAEGELP